MYFYLLGTSAFHVKAKNEKFAAAGSRCRQNLKFDNFTSSFGRLRQNIAPKSVPHVQHDYFVIIDLWCSLLFLITIVTPVKSLYFARLARSPPSFHTCAFHFVRAPFISHVRFLSQRLDAMSDALKLHQIAVRSKLWRYRGDTLHSKLAEISPMRFLNSD